MRKYAKKDSNQDQIVKALRKAGCSVQSLASVGSGCPDLLVGRKVCTGTEYYPYAAFNYLLEIKDGSKPPSARQLTKDEKEWHKNWIGQVCTVTSVEEALIALGFQ